MNEMIGRRLGSYKIIEKTGAGAMATVYRAYQPPMDQYVAVKVIDASLIRDEEAIARFQRQACLIACLEHLHILPVYDFDGAHDPPYIVMRYLESGSALHYAHRQGIVHRDVKPANVLIDTEGNALLALTGVQPGTLDGKETQCLRCST